MSSLFSRRTLLRTSSLAAAGLPLLPRLVAAPASAGGEIRLGIASYTFRNFSRTQLIAWLKQLRVTSINAKDIKDHLPADAAGEAAAGPEDKLWPSPLDVLKDLQGMDARMGLCIDVGHSVRAGTDVVAAIHQAGTRVHNVHMKDLTDFTDKESQVAVGAGKMPVREIFKALKAIGYQGWVDLEYEVHGDDPLPGVTESLAYMRGVLAGMA